MSTAPALPWQGARDRVAEGRELGAVLAEDGTVAGALAPGELDRLLDPANYLGVAAALVDRALAAAREG